jgi:hypothetical protein
MATDLFGKPIGGGSQPEFKLNLQQKRQATLLYHWMSLDYLRGLKDLIDALIKGADVGLELAKRQGRDALLTNERWGVRDTSANWSTHVFPALEDFRKSTIKDIALRATESYEFTGANQCGRMIDEFSSMWMTEEEEENFKKQFEAVYHYAQFIDFAAGVGGRRHQLNSMSMALYWKECGDLFPRLPKFRVRTDVEAVTDKRPQRTGVYVSQDDDCGTLQFAWTGDEDGVLGEVETLNDTGRRITTAVGRDAMWVDGQKMAAYATEAFRKGELTDYGGFEPGDERDPRWVGGILSKLSRTSRPCKWYFVEKVEGEYDDEEPTTSQAAAAVRLRVEAGQPCPRGGFWVTPAKTNSRRQFKAGEVMPDVGGDYGATIWQWDEQQGS